MAKRLLQTRSLEGFAEPEVARWLWALEDVRRVTKRTLHGITQEDLDVVPEGSNSIGGLLMHVAMVEAGWVNFDLLGRDAWPPELATLFPYPDRDEDGWIPATPGVRLEQHLRVLDTVRRWILDVFRPMTLDDWNRPRTVDDYDVTPAWVVYHLIEHEAHHRGQIADWLRIRHGRQRPDGTRQKRQG